MEVGLYFLYCNLYKVWKKIVKSIYFLNVITNVFKKILCRMQERRWHFSLFSRKEEEISLKNVLLQEDSLLSCSEVFSQIGWHFCQKPSIPLFYEKCWYPPLLHSALECVKDVGEIASLTQEGKPLGTKNGINIGMFNMYWPSPPLLMTLGIMKKIKYIVKPSSMQDLQY